MTVAGMHGKRGPRSRRATGTPDKRYEEIRYVASALRGLVSPLEGNVRRLHDLPGYRFSDAALVALDALEDLIFEVEQHEREAEQAADEFRASFAGGPHEVVCLWDL